MGADRLLVCSLYFYYTRFLLICQVCFSLYHHKHPNVINAFQQPPRFKGMTVKKMLSLAAGKELTEAESCKLLSAVGCAHRSISLMMKPDRKLWKRSVWNCNIIVIRNVLNRLNRSKVGRKITPVNSKHSQEFLFWHRFGTAGLIFRFLVCLYFVLLINFLLTFILKTHRWFYFQLNRKTPETLRFRGILRLDTMYLAVLYLYN